MLALVLFVLTHSVQALLTTVCNDRKEITRRTNSSTCFPGTGVFYTAEAKCLAVNITRLEVPALVKMGTESVTLDCEYSTGKEPPGPGLVMKWFFNGSASLVYQWIPPMRPQVIGLLKGKVDTNFKISEQPLQAYRAIRILQPTTDLSGNYTCVVSTFLNEDRKTKPMLVYSSGKNFKFLQEKKYVFLVTLICLAEDLYPKPVMTILAKGKPLLQAVSEMKMDSWGMYTVETKVVVHDDDVATPWEEFTCLLRLPPANYTANRTSIYHPGLMPTAYIAAIEVEKPQERLANANGFQRLTLSRRIVYYLVIKNLFFFDYT